MASASSPDLVETLNPTTSAKSVEAIDSATSPDLAETVNHTTSPKSVRAMDSATSPDLVDTVNPTTSPKPVKAIDSATFPDPEFGEMQRITEEMTRFIGANRDLTNPTYQRRYNHLRQTLAGLNSMNKQLGNAPPTTPKVSTNQFCRRSLKSHIEEVLDENSLTQDRLPHQHQPSDSLNPTQLSIQR
jgi:hypothetical protein